MTDLLKQLVELHQSVKLKKENHKKKIADIDDERANLFYKAAQLEEDTPAMDEVYRRLDLLDSKEFSCYCQLRNFLSLADEQIDKTIKSVVQRRFESIGPLLPYIGSDAFE
jgi:hypothetical protein